MFNSNWSNGAALGIIWAISLTALIGIFVLGLNYCPNSPCSNQSAQSENPKQDKGWLPNALRADSTSNPHPADDEDHDDYYTHQDLDAQNSMAESTEAIVGLSKVSIFLGVAGTLALVWTILETRRAVTVTREIGRDEVRAYVHAKGAKLLWGGPKAQNPSIELSVENVGQTPAKWFEVVSRVIAEPMDESGRVIRDTKFADIDFSGRRPRRWSAIQGKRSCKVIDEADVGTITSAYQKSVCLTVFGTIRYETFFGEIFETEFCFFRKRAPSYEHEVLKEDVIQSGPGIKETNKIVREMGHKMSTTVMNLRAYDKIDG